MVSLRLDQVSIDFPIYNASARSLRRDILRFSVGGRISEDSRHKVVVNALEDISLSLAEGDRLGLIGHNGAGKSTLLRVMAGIYEPVRGTIETEGSVSTIFDLTLGMNPDATGFEQIRLQARFLGINRTEVENIIWDVAEFTELGDYLHLPIRTYSSGMMVRLAFGIATCIQPDILLMDEMIGAGDAAFLHRAQGRLEKFVGGARILTVASHSETVIRDWCNAAALLDHGKLVFVGPVEEALERYRELAQG